jgi:multisubunit Na+/H+ antiporter MnhG subunit
MRDHPAYRWIFLLILAPVGAVVVVAALLLFGVKPHTVFAPGWAVMACVKAIGLHPPNAVGVISTVALGWAIIAVIGLAWERIRR